MKIMRKMVLALVMSALIACDDDDAPAKNDATGTADTAVATDATGTSDACTDCQGHSCCGTACVNLQNDILNCGRCGRVCPIEKPYCGAGQCLAAPPCETGVTCGAGETCCGSTCCAAGKLCCDVPGPVMSALICSDPVDNTCPKGCVMCDCLSPETLIGTPSGPVPVALVAEGDLVYSVHQDAVVVVPVEKTQRVAVFDHRVLRITLENGQSLEVSPGHPTADGRTLDSLSSGQELDGVRVRSVTSVRYHHGHTYDILPASDTGTYFAGSVLIGSTVPR